jgi:hypothetical protein
MPTLRQSPCLVLLSPAPLHLKLGAEGWGSSGIGFALLPRQAGFLPCGGMSLQNSFEVPFRPTLARGH